MSRSDYEPLVAKIRARFLSWTSKALSFAGRLQLINSVIASFTNFWCSAFSLPQGCIDEIDSLCSAFLWSGSPNISAKAKVAWDEVCKPKEEGGLGVRRIKDVSVVFDLKLIWRLFHNLHSPWVLWVKNNILRNNSFWDIKASALGSWAWKKLLNLRPLAKQFLRMEVHSGKAVGFWTDIWHPIGRLIEIIGEIGTHKLGIARNAKIADVLVDNQWRFRNTRDTNIQDILMQVRQFPLLLAHNEDDEVQWKSGEEDYRKKFLAYKTWDMIRTRHNRVPWSKLIWFQQGVPRYAFIAWLAIKDRLSTGVRMRAWGIVQGCSLCGEPDESRNHLFFACPYTYGLWLQVIGSLLRPAPSPDWDEILARILATAKDRLVYILLRIAFQVTVYYIWRERNERRHTQRSRPPTQLAKVIEKTIRQRITSTRYREKTGLEGLMQRWFIAHTEQD